MKKLIEFLNKLERAKIYYKLDKVNDEYIMVEISIPGERWEVEFSDDDVRVEKFISKGLFGEIETDKLFTNYSD